MTSGGWGRIIRRSPSTTVSLAAAWALSRLVALAAPRCASALSTGSWMPSMILSTLSCVYQVLSVSISEKRRMKAR